MSAEPNDFMFVTCSRKETDLVCRPWTYTKTPEGSPAGTYTRHGESVTLPGVMSLRHDDRGRLFVGFVDYADTLARVCAILGHGTQGYSLCTSVHGHNFGNVYRLEVSLAPLWCTA